MSMEPLIPLRLDISDEIKFAWKMQRDMAGRFSKSKIQLNNASPTLQIMLPPQMEFSHVVISILPSTISKEEIGKHSKASKVDSKKWQSRPQSKLYLKIARFSTSEAFCPGIMM